MTAVTHTELVGRWILDIKDESSLRAFGNVSLEFSADGKLTYGIHGASKDQIIFLTYRFDGGSLITNQPSAPREERSSVRFDGSTLIVGLGGREARFVRPE